jgi:prophage regulatory protein
MSDSLLRLDAVKARTGLSRSDVYRRIAEGTFPRPVNLSKRMAAWPSSEVDEWVDRQIALRDQPNEVEHTHA